MKKFCIIALILVLTLSVFAGCGCTNRRPADMRPTDMVPMPTEHTVVPTEAATKPVPAATEHTAPEGPDMNGPTGHTEEATMPTDGAARMPSETAGNRSAATR